VWSGLRAAGRRPLRIKTPRCEVGASRRGLTFGSSTSLGPNSRIPTFVFQASRRALPTASLPVERVRATFPATASAHAVLQRSLPTGSPPVVAVASQSTLSHQRSGAAPPPRAISPMACPRCPTTLPRASGPMRTRGLSQSQGRPRIFLRAARLLRVLHPQPPVPIAKVL
jgi:hypothetical protein